MNLLCVETSTQHLSLAVAKNGGVVVSRNLRLDRPLDKSIMPGIKKVLEDSGLTVNRLNGILVGLGPGSFTSLRVGLSTVKGIAFASNKPVIGNPSLDLVAMNVNDDVQVCVICDARRDLVYTCLYEKKGETLQRTGDYRLVSIGEVLKDLEGDVTFVGDGLKLYREEIERAWGFTPTFAAEKDFLPQARNLVPLCAKRVAKGKWDRIDKLVPLYLYPDHCQIKPGGKKKKEAREK